MKILFLVIVASALAGCGEEVVKTDEQKWKIVYADCMLWRTPTEVSVKQCQQHASTLYYKAEQAQIFNK